VINLAYDYQDERPTEMLDGVIYMMASPRLVHIRVGRNIEDIFKKYFRGKSCDVFGDPAKVFLTENDRVVPDVTVVCDENIIKDEGIFGVPDLIVEILSPSTSKRDKTYKKSLYEKCGVKEYWIVDIDNLSIEVFWLTDGKYLLHDVFTILPEYEKQDMTIEKISEFTTRFKTSIAGGLVIDLEEVFEDVIERSK